MEPAYTQSEAQLREPLGCQSVAGRGVALELMSTHQRVESSKCEGASV